MEAQTPRLLTVLGGRDYAFLQPDGGVFDSKCTKVKGEKYNDSQKASSRRTPGLWEGDLQIGGGLPEVFIKETSALAKGS